MSFSLNFDGAYHELDESFTEVALFVYTANGHGHGSPNYLIGVFPYKIIVNDVTGTQSYEPIMKGFSWSFDTINNWDMKVSETVKMVEGIMTKMQAGCYDGYEEVPLLDTIVTEVHVARMCPDQHDIYMQLVKELEGDLQVCTVHRYGYFKNAKVLHEVTAQFQDLFDDYVIDWSHQMLNIQREAVEVIELDDSSDAMEDEDHIWEAEDDDFSWEEKSQWSTTDPDYELSDTEDNAVEIIEIMDDDTIHVSQMGSSIEV